MFLDPSFDDDFYFGTKVDEDLQERAVRLNTLCRVYEQADRVLTGDPVIVNVVHEGEAPAWSDGQSITFNLAEIDDMDLESLTQLNGLNYHELAHHLYTPRKGTTLVQWVINNGYNQAFNALEDQRIETLLVGRYPAIVPFLQATCSRWLAETPEEAVVNYVAIRGRRYLPREIRQGFREIFAFPELIPTIVDIIDKYRALAFPRDYLKAQLLIERFYKEVLVPMGVKDKWSAGPAVCGPRAPISKGRPEPGKAQEKDAVRGAKYGQAESPFIPKAEKPVEVSDDLSDKNPTNQTTKQDPYQPKSPEEAVAIREHRMQQNSGGYKPYGHVASVGGLPSSLNDLLNHTVEQVLQREDVQQDIKAKQRVIVGGDGKHEDSTKNGKFDSTTVPYESVTVYRKFAQELMRLRDDLEPTWIRETPSGKFNVKRVMNGCDPDVAFDRWDEGSDGCNIEAVILVDRSGSMSSNQNDRKASLACWTIKRALESIDSPVTVYAFDDASEVAYKRDEKAHKTMYKFIFGDGGTHPYKSLLAAEQLFIASRRANKMLFIITDGVFDKRQNDEVIERIAKRGVLTSCVLIMNEKEYKWNIQHNYIKDEKELGHGAEIYARIESAADLTQFAKAVVTGAIRKRATR